MLSFLQAAYYAIVHPYTFVDLTIVRRYVDAQKNFIGELYENGKMIGASCDNLPFDASKLKSKPSLCWNMDFLSPLAPNTIRVGGQEPKDNEAVRKRIAARRFSINKVTVLNRFVEHVMENDCAR